MVTFIPEVEIFRYCDGSVGFIVGQSLQGIRTKLIPVFKGFFAINLPSAYQEIKFGTLSLDKWQKYEGEYKCAKFHAGKFFDKQC